MLIANLSYLIFTSLSLGPILYNRHLQLLLYELFDFVDIGNALEFELSFLLVEVVYSWEELQVDLCYYGQINSAQGMHENVTKASFLLEFIVIL